MRLPFLLLLLCTAPARGAAGPRVLIDDPGELAKIEAAGGSLLARLAPAAASGGGPVDNAALAKASGAWRDVVKSLTADLAALAAGDPMLGIGMHKSHRLFDARWLTSAAAHFELAGVVNRLDRQPFHPETCGELRFVYRLKYATPSHGETLTSRLPMTVNLVSWQLRGKDPDCRGVATRGLAGALLDKDALHVGRIKSLETNLQSVRWPSTIRPDLGAHAEYELRVFKLDAKATSASLDLLENTPDVARLRDDPARLKRLVAWASAHLKAIDDGTALIPDEFLARRITSVSPRGMARLANRPFRRLLEPARFASLALGTYKTIKTPAALMRRLDDLSCSGCHQARTVAGFHLLGVDRPDTSMGDAVAVSGSPHLLGDLARRGAYVAAVAAGTAADPARPLSEHPEAGAGGYGAHCGLGDAGFAAWTCAAGLVCRALGLPAGDRTVGQCFPAVPEVGGPCESGTMRPHPDGRRDRVVGAQESGCGAGVCEVNQVGFPDGMCATACDDAAPHVACGAIAVLATFNACLGRGRPFTECLADNVRPAGLRRCGPDEPCRDDYLCAQTGKPTTGREGTCIPPYFLFQMRVDGHPSPP